MSDLQKRFGAQRPKLLKEGPKNSRRATPPLPEESLEAAVKLRERLEAESKAKRKEIVEPLHFKYSVKAALAMMERFRAEREAKQSAKDGEVPKDR